MPCRRAHEDSPQQSRPSPTLPPTLPPTLQVLGSAFLFSAFVCLLVWVLWLFGAIDGERQFWFSNRLRFSRAAQCNTTDFEAAGLVEVDGIPICTAAFLLWVSPFILFGVLLFLGLFLLLLTRMLTAADARSTQFAVKFLVAAVFATMFGMYSSTSVGGAGMELADVALSVFAVMLVGIVVVAGATVGWDTLAKKMEVHGGVNHMGPTSRNLVHAFAVCFGAFIFPVFLALSYLNQQLRKVAPACGMCKPLTGGEREQRLTSLATRKLRLLAAWDWGRVLTYVYWLCLVGWVLIFFTKMTYIFFNWLVATLQPLPFLGVLAIFVVIGLAMFLIPVVPGPAVYLTAGVLVVPLGKSHFLQSAGFSSNSTFDACNPASGTEEGTGESCAVARPCAARPRGPSPLACPWQSGPSGPRVPSLARSPSRSSSSPTCCSRSSSVRTSAAACRCVPSWGPTRCR